MSGAVDRRRRAAAARRRRTRSRVTHVVVDVGWRRARCRRPAAGRSARTPRRGGRADGAAGVASATGRGTRSARRPATPSGEARQEVEHVALHDAHVPPRPRCSIASITLADAGGVHLDPDQRIRRVARPPSSTSPSPPPNPMSSTTRARRAPNTCVEVQRIAEHVEPPARRVALRTPRRVPAGSPRRRGRKLRA